MAKKTAKTLADFKAEYDPDIRIPAQIRKGLESLLAEGREAWEYDADFIKRCGSPISNTNITPYREMFAKHVVLVKHERKNSKRVWFADVKIAAKARGEI